MYDSYFMGCLDVGIVISQLAYSLVTSFWLSSLFIIVYFLGSRAYVAFCKKRDEIASKEYLKWFDCVEIKADYQKLRQILIEQNRTVYLEELEKLLVEFNKVKEKVLHYESVLCHFNRNEISSKMEEIQELIKNTSLQTIEREMHEKQLADLLKIKVKIDNIEAFFRAYEHQKKCLIVNFQLLQMQFLDGRFDGEQDPLRKTFNEILSINEIVDKVEKYDAR